MDLCVMGLGYIGLPTATLFANSGIRVHGVDINPEVVRQLQIGEIQLSEPELGDMVKKVLQNGCLTASSQPVPADVYLISVPTPLQNNKTANLEYVRQAVEMILSYVTKGNLIILESTVPPKTVHHFLIPLLKKTGLRIGEELYISYAPERVYPGRLIEEMIQNDRIVGGINEISTKMTVELYQHFVKGNIHMTDALTAEMIKLMENAYRDLNIALANELARMAEIIGINIWEAIELANSHQRVNIHKPGPGVGGHCIAVDPWFLVQAAPAHARLVSLARTLNEETPQRIVKMIEHLVKGKEQPIVTLLGLAYKANVDDIRESPALVVLDLCKAKGYTVRLFDPHVTLARDEKVSSWAEAVRGTDCIVLLTDHSVFTQLDFASASDLVRSRAILDTRNQLNAKQLREYGFRCFTIGTQMSGEFYLVVPDHETWKE